VRKYARVCIGIKNDNTEKIPCRSIDLACLRPLKDNKQPSSICRSSLTPVTTPRELLNIGLRGRFSAKRTTGGTHSGVLKPFLQRRATEIVGQITARQLAAQMASHATSSDCVRTLRVFVTHNFESFAFQYFTKVSTVNTRDRCHQKSRHACAKLRQLLLP